MTVIIAPISNKLRTFSNNFSQEMQSVDELLIKYLHSDIDFINLIATYIIQSGGKRIRPLFILLVAKTLGSIETNHVLLAAIVECLHTSTLLHDDVVDKSEMRRGHKTINTLWGNQASILVGDFLYSKAFQMMIAIKKLKVLEILANASNTIATGEVLQLVNIANPSLAEQDYYQVITRKTAELFKASAHLSALLSKASIAQQKQYAAIGYYVGMAYQLLDDLMDYVGSPEEIGKNIGDDLAEGKITLPLLYALNSKDKKYVSIIHEAIVKRSLTDLTLVQEALTATGAIDYTIQKAHYYTDLALKTLDCVEPLAHNSSALRELIQLMGQRAY